ncbi:electron transfer flavoprotein-ubiquinone oxidoreductase [Methyloversatilis sp.]|uniref:electron transfer flavoprotein-ubiquinone oxidoreductase n=1 Tax=Methyloversatilis sp. TaxID=2569862 RepID=UPI002734149E|nr:electron transfer flavoprotein-ubiquinone oxidoreductase [Methyloversatilis sp.]MDP2867475.1 electron transfer flavoprotein-ubiquinone oxidoreductase [Methyloversatilis sp.]MDP3455638.1 electron transfer flavoprotein-ubiquinone oxidoreductase [Methyloversatilis sp.]MDP3577499.1 electron transfer flavoprotein-ubiquinone oxidoreductase [Methyloversatilis sp.]
MSDIERESMDFDLLVVGAGPAGLAAAIRAKQKATEAGHELSVCVIEKGAEVGAHILSGAVMDPRALTELLPDWQARGAPLHTRVTQDRMYFLSETGARAVPGALLPQSFHNDGNYIVRLGHVVKWLGEQAGALGVDIFPGFAGSALLFDDDNRVAGVVTGDMGVGRDGTPGGAYQPGMALRAKYTLFAEGCRGHLGKQLEARYNLRDSVDPQTYGLGIKELWEVPAGQSQPGLVVHTAGWPLDNNTYGGGFIYHLKDNLVAIGYVVGLNYSNPWLSPYEEFQRYKTHPTIRSHIEGGTRLAYGARAITAGGLQSLPKLVFPGGALIGDDAGFLNAARIKGSHAAIKSGMLAADAAVEALAAGRAQDALDAYPAAFRISWLRDELHQTRNFKPYMKKGLWFGSFLFGAEQLLFKGNVPWTLRNEADHTTLAPAATRTPIDYPKPDGVLTFDRLSSVFLSSTNHEEDQPCHLLLKDAGVAITVNLAAYESPEQRYCPAGVYEIVREASGPRLQINAQNCVHCKSCDIKDPTQNIHWVTPQGGEGPIYNGL